MLRSGLIDFFISGLVRSRMQKKLDLEKAFRLLCYIMDLVLTCSVSFFDMISRAGLIRILPKTVKKRDLIFLK